jgi:thiol-disulfide isomerase/thioredoxin
MLQMITTSTAGRLPFVLLLFSALAASTFGSPVRAETIDFELPMLGAEPVRLSDWRGQWVVVNYWATWCAPCRKEIPDFSAMHDARDDITVLGLAFEDTDIETFEEFLNDYPASYPILLVDVYSPPDSLGAPRALPTTYLVDPSGVLVETWLGPITSEIITTRIDTGG